MLHRRVISVPLLLLLLMTTGCTFFRFIGNNSSEEIRKFATSKDDSRNESRVPENEKSIYLAQLASQQAEIVRMNRDLNYWQIEIAHADKRIFELNKIIDDLNAQMKLRQETTQVTPAPPQETGKKTESENKAVKIKVLTGDGKIASAHRMSKKLGSMGYQVMQVDRARRSDFKVNTVFFKAGHQTAAMTLAKQLGKDAISKPLTWPSVFNIIVVTGRLS
jgi:hypothetical protein